MAEVELRQVVKKFGEVDAVRAIDLEIPNNEFVVLVGPSGCGKSTTLRMIAGLEEATSGEICIDGQVVNDLPPKDRDIAMVFQNYALYPHMTAFENMSFGLKLRKLPKAEIRTRVEQAARILDITELLDRRPKALSGGQRQRVAMGRAIVRNPKVFLFDEPLSNLDAKLRVQMRTEIKRVHQKVKTTTVYVTHDQVEAMTLADRVVVMNGGRIEQIGTPQELYHQPRTRFVAGFIGSPGMNFIPCRLERAGDGLGARVSDAITFPVPAEKAARYRPAAGKELILGLRPEHVTEPRRNGHGEPCTFSTMLDVVEPMGMETMVYFSLNGAEVCGRVDPNSAAEAGAAMMLQPNLDHMHLIDPATGQVL
ncbi:MAG TPA: sn-glycerol-3-phosphate ABC transporter ATP-binding protein UgpC [Pseudolabrys sp.]|jgi:multiple sugar transport system ATP-binding protein|nr:sn-glycerol-3-phosphate ABC transporter ATP-binding protein UgpC [Pseudolabrys sp.]